MKLAVLSGTFNPIHNAHIALAEFVKSNFNYDKILLIPAHKPPFKDDDGDFSIHRFNMVKTAAKNLNGVEVSDIEYQSETKSYSYLTIKKLYNLYDIYGKIGFIIGTDAYKDLYKWYEAEKLKELVEFIVFERGTAFDDIRVQEIENKGFRMIKTNLPFKDISSSEIRQRIKEGKKISNLVPLEVEEYINENGLYK